MKKALRIVLLSICILLVVSVVAIIKGQYDVTHPLITTDIDDYGTYKGNYDNKSVSDYIKSFFPEKIEDKFTNVMYSYRAQKGDTYAFEAYLEFVIEDTQEYNTFVERYTNGMTGTAFKYDESFIEYTIDERFALRVYDDPAKEVYLFSDIHFIHAKMGKILFSDEEQRIIFVALAVHDGGVASADFLCTYFNRFAINPVNMTESVYYSGKK